MTSPQPPLVTDTAYRDPNVGRVATLSQENDDLRREAERLREDLARVRASNRAETVRAAVGGVLTLAVLAACVLGIGATARTCAYGNDARRNAEREAAEWFRRSHGAAPFGVLCADTNQPQYDYACTVYRVAGDPTPLRLRCDSDPAKWSDGCADPRGSQ